MTTNITGEYLPQEKLLKILVDEKNPGSIPFYELKVMAYKPGILPDDVVFELNEIDPSGLAVKVINLWLTSRKIVRMRTNSTPMKETVDAIYGDRVVWA